MLWPRKLDSYEDNSPRKKLSLFIDRTFQLKYGMFILASSLTGMAVAVLPVHYFLRQNYNIFLDLAYSYAPSLIEHLEREQVWVTSILFAGFSGMVVFFLMLSLRMTSRVIAPLRIIRNHLRKLTRGHWYIAEVKTREHDEFQDLVDTYNYFFESFRAQLIRDLDILKKIKVDQSDPESLRLWHNLVEERCLQLNLKKELPYSLLTADSSSATSGSHGSRHAS